MTQRTKKEMEMKIRCAFLEALLFGGVDPVPEKRTFLQLHILLCLIFPPWVILVPFKCMSALTPVKVVPLISMQVTWLQILNFTCKCGANDLNSI